MDLGAAKQEIVAEVDRLADLLVDASRQIHAHPELGFEEYFAHDLLTGILEDQGLSVERHAYGLETAFVAEAGASGPLVAVCCEYDALPGLGHACGHNVIAAAGLGAGLAAARIADACGGRVRILGTPAEEGGGGKVLMIRAGALAGVDAAMMIHPASCDLRAFGAIAIQQLWVTYRGVAAHAAAAPHLGRNALDAAVLGYVNVAALRQHIAADERVHGIFTEAGDQPNIVPARAAAQWYVRSRDLRSLEALKARVLACLRAGADAAGCEMTHEWKDPAYADLVDIDAFIDLYAQNAAMLGRTVLDPAEATPVIGSTDMGNVSYEVPSIHPMIAVGPPGVPIHSEEFAVHAGAEGGDRAVLDGAKAMGMTIVDLWLRPGALDEIRRTFTSLRPT